MKNFCLILFCCLLFSAGTMNLYAAERNKSSGNKSDACKLISSNEAISRAKSKTGGKVVSVKLNRKGAKSTYRVRVLVGEKRIKNITIKACR